MKAFSCFVLLLMATASRNELTGLDPSQSDPPEDARSSNPADDEKVEGVIDASFRNVMTCIQWQLHALFLVT